METKFNLNRPPINDEEINSNKDFRELIKKFKQQSITKARKDKNFFKNKKTTYSAIIAGVAVVCTVTYFSVFNNNKNKNTTNDKTTTSLNSKSQNQNTNAATSSGGKKQAYINAPIKKISIPYTSYKVNATNGGQITHPSKTKITIPKNAFVNHKGDNIIGEVEIQYREFHHQADIIASGIPMRYDSANVSSTFESAGMFDIKGFQNNEQVFINPKKQITIEFASSNNETKFNQYVLDTIAKNWKFTQRDVIKNQEVKLVSSLDPDSNRDENKTTIILKKQLAEIPPKIEKEKVITNTKINALAKPDQPIKPTKATNGRPQFELDVDYKEFPELAAFKNAVFEVGNENKKYNPKTADVVWSSAQISEGPQKGKNYLLTLKLKQQVEQLIVYPALTGANYDNAVSNYDKKFNEYRTLLAKREANEQKLKAEFEAKQLAYINEQKKLQDELLKEQIKLRLQQQQQLTEQFNSLSHQQKVTRLFQVSNFGIYNSDCASPNPNDNTINPIYLVNNESIKPESIFLVSHTKNMVYNLAYGKLSYNNNDTYSLCIMVKGKAYLCNKDLFKAAVIKKQVSFECVALNDNIDNVIDFRKALEI